MDKANALQIAEVKRIKERLTKRELADICGLSYNYYINCSTGHNPPSKNMTSKLLKYVDTPTGEVYNMVFNLREEEEVPHKMIKVDDSMMSSLAEELASKGVTSEPGKHTKMIFDD